HSALGSLNRGVRRVVAVAIGAFEAWHPRISRGVQDEALSVVGNHLHAHQIQDAVVPGVSIRSKIREDEVAMRRYTRLRIVVNSAVADLGRWELVLAGVNSGLILVNVDAGDRRGASFEPHPDHLTRD